MADLVIAEYEEIANVADAIRSKTGITDTMTLSEMASNVMSISGTDITIDSELSETSTNPVQNKVVTKEIRQLSEEIADQVKKTGGTEEDVFTGFVDAYVNNGVLQYGALSGVKTAIVEMKKGATYIIEVEGENKVFATFETNSVVSGTQMIPIWRDEESKNVKTHTYKNTLGYGYLVVYISGVNNDIKCSIIEKNDNVTLLVKKEPIYTQEQTEKAIKENLTNYKNEECFDGNFRNFGVSSGKIWWNPKVISTLITMTEGVTYNISVSGIYNRFVICICDSLLGNTDALTVHSESVTDQRERTFKYTNDDGKKYLFVCVAYSLENLDCNCSITIENSDNLDLPFELNGIRVPTYNQMVNMVEKYTHGSYASLSDVSNVGKTSDLYAMYDNLIESYPDYVTKNVLGQNSLGSDVVEYVFSHNNYNVKETRRTKDSEIEKPVVLIVTGLHGDERSSVMGTYQFAKDLCEYSTDLFPLREKIVFKIIPVGVPYSFDNNRRLNENNVNINRNFTTNWTLTSAGNDYSGESPADQMETQVIESWIAQNSNASLFIDFHNSGYEDEVSYLAGANSVENMMTLKKAFLKGIDDVIPHWERDFKLNPELIMSYTGDFYIAAFAYRQAQATGILSTCLECSWNQNGSGKHSDLTIKVNAESLGNMLLGILKYSEIIS